MKALSRSIAAAGLFSAVMLSGVSAVSAQESVEEFYSGRTMEMIIGYSPGGGYDQYARLVARHLGQYIPGNPEIIPRNMPGASSFLATNYLYNVAPQDGSVLGAVAQSIGMSQAMDDVQLDVDVGEFHYIGSPTMENNVLITWHTSPVATFEDALETSIPIGATGGSTSSQYPAIMNALLDTQFEIITGYPGGNEINYAMESGEVDGRGSVNWASLVPLGWHEDGMINVITQIGLQREAALPDTPLLFELATNEEDEQLLRLLSAPTAMGRPIMTTPNVPEERVQALRDAFDQMIADPAFIEAAEVEGLSIIPISGEALQAISDEILSAPEDVALRLGEFIGVQE